MIVVGLTGSIGMGKSTAAAVLRQLGVPVFDADREVHRLLGEGGAAVAAVEAAFPGVRTNAGGIDRRQLGQRVFARPRALRGLEGILHPLVRAAEKRFVARARARGEPIVVLDIPLLFESGGAYRCDCIIVVSAPARLQRERVLRRPGISESRFRAILASQMPDREKRRRADFVVMTGLGRWEASRRLRRIVRMLRERGWRHAVRGRRALPWRGRG